MHSQVRVSVRTVHIVAQVLVTAHDNFFVAAFSSFLSRDLECIEGERWSFLSAFAVYLRSWSGMSRER